MRYFVTIALVLFAIALAADTNDFGMLKYPAPEFMQCIYDQFSTNYLGAVAAGRGHTGVAVDGGVDVVLHNPASLSLSGAEVYVEVIVKPSIDEMNTNLYTTQQDKVSGQQRYNSTIPFGMAGFGGKVMQDGSYAILLSAPKTIEYDSFSRELMTDEIATLQPTYTHSQLVGAYSHHYGDFNFGMNILLDFHKFKDYRNPWTLGKQSETKSAFRVQPGIRWNKGGFSVGAAYTMASDIDYDMNYGENYTATIPSVISGGVSWRNGGWLLAADVEQQMCSEQADEFDDRMRLKFGLEKQHEQYTFRLGVMQVPGVYEGDVVFPDNPYDSEISENEDYWPYEDDPETDEYDGTDFLTFESTDQLFLTGGVTYSHMYGDINLAIMSDVTGDVPVTQLLASLKFNLEQLKNSFHRN